MPKATAYAYHFKKALKATGLVRADGKPQYTPQGLRHFLASTALANGVPIHEVSRRLGHKSIRTTVDIYSSHPMPGAAAGRSGWTSCGRSRWTRRPRRRGRPRVRGSGAGADLDLPC
ncbi:tyrosine-type recombinase/integrase [Streptomyces ipomoeae]|uniref:Tyr recombinase domain-containing protein n=2 Tax=Streptomyces ipomoeae TaxID=103232 RepID=L1KHX7_9ACTN|nr:tyrosine-type recombinase/integrase [Streptomyces ipomoeae]EKX60095.1 hypothetical protein STRIP9103_06466 [Streptomyces ipomoeae 91-03]MDX2693796.1 tyrosine-type recombinase/integrase [Streptomyces ipomoeae]MDX2827816.1 tyrosine-type recombinase/integrase [Streptomyces ipomoeae]MDX2839217.1 tyrosine-type recombinase/integrase [Streptomyces ipomoeae]MDX2880369.1 tyrosine-type recombinase/integrase [Streptomyces ipomoeae]